MAGLRSSSYTVALSSRHRRAAQIGRATAIVAALAASSALGGCGIVMPLSSLMAGPADETTPPAAEVTGSIPKPAAAPLDGDAEAVRAALVASAARGVEAPVAWKNDGTGHSGTVTASTATRASNGAPCRDFETTLVSVSGVDLHAGRICQGFSGGWEVLRFARVGG